MSPDTNAAIAQLSFARDRMVLTLANGHRSKLPLSRFPQLARADVQARERWQLMEAGAQVHWPTLGLTLSKVELLAAR